MKFLFKEARAEAHELLRTREQRTPWQGLAVLLGASLPVPLFAWVYFCCFSGLRFYFPGRALILGPVVALAICGAASDKAWRNVRGALPSRTLVSLAASFWLALGLGIVGGEHNYWFHMVSYYKFQDLAAYTNIDPSVDKGQSYMDAGQVYFREFSQVVTEQMVAYRSGGVYCAAPILSRPLSNGGGEERAEQDGPLQIPESGTVDFWAVGVGCCDLETRAFTCGAVGDPRARAGIRLLRDDIRPFYFLAVQQWAARLCPLEENTAAGLSRVSPLICPEAKHPLFFLWVEDPLFEVDTFYTKAMSMYGMHVFMFFVSNLFVTLALLWAFFQMGLR